MDAQSAEGTVNQILFEIDRVPDLTSPEPVTDCVDAMFEGRYFMHSAAEYLEAMKSCPGPADRHRSARRC